MKSKRLFTAIGNIDDKFIIEDAEVFTAPKDRRSERSTFAPWWKLAMPVAACLVIAIGVFVGQNNLFVPPNVGGDESLFAPSEQTGLATSETPVVPGQSEGLNTPAKNHPQMPVIVINELPEITAVRLAIELKPEDFVPMSKDEVVNFYGFDFFPTAIPADMKIVEESAYGIYMRDEGTGEVYYSANLAWYVDENVSKQLQVNIDKGELPHSCFAYLGVEYERSVINGTELLIGRSVDRFGEERFVAEMMYAGNGLRIESSNLTQTEFVDIVTSLLQSADIIN